MAEQHSGAKGSSISYSHGGNVMAGKWKTLLSLGAHHKDGIGNNSSDHSAQFYFFHPNRIPAIYLAFINHLLFRLDGKSVMKSLKDLGDKDVLRKFMEAVTKKKYVVTATHATVSRPMQGLEDIRDMLEWLGRVGNIDIEVTAQSLFDRQINSITRFVEQVLKVFVIRSEEGLLAWMVKILRRTKHDAIVINFDPAFYQDGWLLYSLIDAIDAMVLFGVPCNDSPSATVLQATFDAATRYFHLPVLLTADDFDLDDLKINALCIALFVAACRDYVEAEEQHRLKLRTSARANSSSSASLVKSATAPMGSPLRAQASLATAAVTSSAVEKTIQGSTITIVVHYANNLPKMNRFASGDCDPYVKIYIDAFKEIKSLVLRTDTIKQTGNPKWGKEFQLAIPVGSHLFMAGGIVFEVWDEDTVMKDSIIGEVYVGPLYMFDAENTLLYENEKDICYVNDRRGRSPGSAGSQKLGTLTISIRGNFIDKKAVYNYS